MTVLKTLVIVYDPVVDKSTGKKLSQYMRWNKVEELAKGYMSDILEVSGGLARHQIIQRIDVDDFPAKVNGYKYDAEDVSQCCPWGHAAVHAAGSQLSRHHRAFQYIGTRGKERN